MALVINGVEPTFIIVNGVGLDAVQVSKDNEVVVVWVFAVPKSAEISGTITRHGGALPTTYYADITIYNPNGYACAATIKEYKNKGNLIKTSSATIEANSNYETSNKFNDNSRTGAYKVQVTLTNKKGSSTSIKTWNGYEDGGDETTTTTTTT